MAIALTLISVCCGCVGAVLSAQAGFGLGLTLLSYLICATLGSGAVVALALRHTELRYDC